MSRTGREKGVSLAKGPAGLIGLAMIAWGVIHFISGGTSFSASPPDGAVTGESFLGLVGNGWTNVLWAGGGLLLAFGAPLHYAAKTMAMIVGLVLGAAALVGASDGADVFGIFAVNGATSLAQGAVAVALLLVAFLPRVGGGRRRHEDRDVVDDTERTDRFDRTPAEERAAHRDPADERAVAGATASDPHAEPRTTIHDTRQPPRA